MSLSAACRIMGYHPAEETTMFTKILLPSDASEGAQKEARAAAALVEKLGATLVILNVSEIASELAQLNVPRIDINPAIIADLQEAALRTTGSLVAERGVVYTARKETGYPAEVIVRVAGPVA